MKLCRGANSHSDHFLGQGKYRFKAEYRTHAICKCHKKNNVGRLREPSMITFYQKQLGKEFENTKKEGAA
jgi:hypothetical protein